MKLPLHTPTANPRVKQLFVVLLILALGTGAGAYLLRTKKAVVDDGHEHGHGPAAHDDHKEGEPTKGPKGGKLFTEAGYSLEMTIVESGGAPEFRIYTYKDGKPAAPNLSRVTATVERLGRKAQEYVFAPEGDYLKAQGSVDEPHSFAVQILSQFEGKPYIFAYEQVEARVSLTDEQMKSSGVGVGVVGPARIQSKLQLAGEVTLNQDRSAQVVPRLAGLVESVAVNVGDRVRRGQVVAVVNSQALADQRAELETVSKRLVVARANFEREKKLWEDKVSAKQDYLQAQQALSELEITERALRQKLSSMGALASTAGRLTRYEIRSPIDGVITQKKISVGEVVKDDANIFTVADLSSVWVDVNVYAKDLNVVKVGQKVTVKSTAFESSAEGALSYVGALIGSQTRTAVARIVLSNPKGMWHPGLPVSVELVSGEARVAKAISVEAVQTLRDAPMVFGRYGNVFEARPVVLGRSDGVNVEVMKGLEIGEQYAARNSYVIKADIGKASASHDH
jgi:membrane fusion protein, heavy metal efflux system